MIYYIESRNTDPFYNLALEQFAFDRLGRENSFFMLWQNHNSIIIGKHQNTIEEINEVYVKEHGITVARRLSGGGAVYHDLGNLNYTFISGDEPGAGDRRLTDPKSLYKSKTTGIDFSAFCEPIRQALRSFGVPVEISGRNDMTVEGKKFSGNAQYIKQGRVMHHGTILYDSNLEVLSGALKPGNDKIESKGIKSVQNRVTNIRPYMKNDMPIADFWISLKESIGASLEMRDYSLTGTDLMAVEELREKVYSQWSWNYGNSPPYTLRRVNRVEGCGKIEVLLDIGREGIIKNMAFYGDFFGDGDPAELGKALAGHHLEYGEIKNELEKIAISHYFHALDSAAFLTLLFGSDY